jgi:hypothetical protein
MPASAHSVPLARQNSNTRSGVDRVPVAAVQVRGKSAPIVLDLLRLEELLRGGGQLATRLVAMAGFLPLNR